MSPEKNNSMSCRNNPRKAHCEEKRGPKGPKARVGKTRCKESNNDKDTEKRDGSEIKEACVRVAKECVVYWSKEGTDYHEGDACVIEAPKEEVEAFGVTS